MCANYLFIKGATKFDSSFTVYLAILLIYFQKGWFTQFLLIAMSMKTPVTFSNPHNLSGLSERESIPPSADAVEAQVLKCK